MFCFVVEGVGRRMESLAATENFVTDGHVDFDEWVVRTTDIYIFFY